MEEPAVKKKWIITLVVIVLLLGLGAAGAVGYLWYRDNHVFVEGDAYPIDTQSLDLTEEDISVAYYEELREKLPDCEITWVVPFQGRKMHNTVQSISVSALTLEDIEMLEAYFPELVSVDASQSTDYEMLEVLKERLPDLEVIYSVSLGGRSYAPDITDIVLENGDYDFVTLLDNLIYLRDLTAVKLRMPELTDEQMEQLTERYENVCFTSTVEIFGKEYDVDTIELDLSGMTGNDVAEVAQQLKKLPNLSMVNLNPENGIGALSLEDVKALMEAAPNVKFDFTFDFYGHQLSTADEEVHIRNTKIGDEGEQTVRNALDLLKNCKRFVLENCQISNEVMAKIREDYRDQTKVVWRVFYGKGSTLTDAEIIRAVYDLVDDNCHNLVYCEDARFMDIGHNEWLDACEFVSGMKSLEYVIISGAPIKDLTPFQNCKNLKVLEAAFCEYIYSAEPLRHCTSLEYLNISYTHITDLSPLDDLNLANLCAMYYPRSRVPQEEQDRFQALKPNCKMNFVGSQPYGDVWRYDEEGEYEPWYKLIRDVFRYEIFPDTPNHVGWYLKDEELAQIEEVQSAAREAAANRLGAAAQQAETLPEEVIPEETISETTAVEENNE